MLWLSDAAIDYGVRMCVENKRYHVVVGIKRRSDARIVIERIIDSFRKQLGTTTELTIRSDIVICNYNNSYVRIVTAIENALGNRAHLLIMDDYIDREIINVVFRPMEIDYIGYGYRTDVQFMDEIRANNDILWTITIYDNEPEDEEEPIITDGIVSEDELMQILGY